MKHTDPELEREALEALCRYLSKYDDLDEIHDTAVLRNRKKLKLWLSEMKKICAGESKKICAGESVYQLSEAQIKSLQEIDLNILSDLSSAYSKLSEFQTKLDEDDHILSRLQQDSADHHAAIDLITERRKELDRELRKVKENIVEIESMWRG